MPKSDIIGVLATHIDIQIKKKIYTCDDHGDYTHLIVSCVNNRAQMLCLVDLLLISSSGCLFIIH